MKAHLVHKPYKMFAGFSQQKQLDVNVQKSDPGVQAVINAQILEQLDRIG